MHKIVLLKEENLRLCEANQLLSQRRRPRKTRVRYGGALSLHNIQDLESQKDVEQQLKREERSQESRTQWDKTYKRRCGRCN